MYLGCVAMSRHGGVAQSVRTAVLGNVVYVAGNAAFGVVGLEVNFVKPTRRGRERGPNNRAGVVDAVVKGHQEAVLFLDHVGLVFEVSVDVLLRVPGWWLAGMDGSR